MKNKHVVFVLLILMLGACARYTGFRYFPGAPRFAGTDPATVQLLRHDPRRPHIQLGEVWIKPEPRWSPYFVEQQLREQAAYMGAQAVVIVQDRFTRGGVVVENYWRGPYVYRERVIVGVAIRFQ